MYWSRACAQADGSLAGPTDADICDDSEVKFGVVLFDPLAARINDTEARVTLRSLHWPTDVVTQQAGTTTPAGTLWCVVGLTAEDPTTLIAAGTNLGLLLGVSSQRPMDVLDVRMWSIAAGQTAQVTNVWPGGSDTTRPFILQTQRKLGSQDTIVALFGFLTHFGSALAAGQGLFASVNMVISALWQRTLR